MAAETHSFIDIAALDGVRQHVAAGDAVVVLGIDLAHIVWCNGPGAALLGFSGIEAGIGAETGLSRAARRQIEAMPGFPNVGANRSVGVRLAAGMISQITTLLASNLRLPGGEATLMLVAPAAHPASRDERFIAARAISGFEDAGNYVALLDATGEALAATPGFERLGLDRGALERLIADVASEKDRLLKRIVRIGGRAMPVGFARLIDSPVRHLLITVDEGASEERQPVAIEAPMGVVDDSQRAGAARPPQASVEAADSTPDAADMHFERTADIDRDIAADSALMRDAGAPHDRDAEAPSAEAVVAPPADTRPAADVASAQAEERSAPQHDNWYFSDHGPADAQPGSGLAADRDSAPVRFVWRTDAEGRFSAISPEFVAAVGAQAGDVVGQNFADVAKRLGLDPDEEVIGLLARRDTWSGRSVLWPIAGTDLRAPVDLAALPAYGRERVFEGFRGFGVVRTGDAVVDPDAIGLSLTALPGAADGGRPESITSGDATGSAAAQPTSDVGADPFHGEVPALEIEPKPQRRFSDKVIRLAEHRPTAEKGLTPVERNAFREIGEQLKRTSGVAPRTTSESETDANAGAAAADAPMEASPAKADEPPAMGSDAIARDAKGEAPATAPPPARTIAATDAPEWRAPSADKSGSNAADAPPTKASALPPAGPPADEADAPAAATAAGDAGMETSVADAQHGPVANTPTEATPSASGEIAETADAMSAEKHAAQAPGGEMPPSRVSRSLLDFAIVADNGNAPSLEPGAETPPEDGGAAASEASVPDLVGEGATTETQDSAPVADAGATQPETPAAEPPIPVPPLKQGGFLPSAFAERRPDRADTSILAQLPIPVLIHAGDTLHYANEAFLELTGYGSLEQFAAEGGLDALLSGPTADRKDGDNQVMLRTRQGAEIPVSAFLQSVPWLGGKALLLTLTRQPVAASPISPTPPADDPDLRARVAELRTILDTATDGVVLIDNDAMVRSISRPAEALFGYDGDQLVGKPFVSLFAIESQRAARDYLSGLSEHGVASVLNDGREVIGREAQGRFIPLFMTIGRLPGNGGFCAVLRDITQWKRAEEDLTQARAQAERTSSQKSDFLARVSHEIRTPLNAIIGFSELMLDEKFGPVANDRYRDYLRDINRSGNHVLDLVNDLLDISKIEAGQQEMDYEAVALNDALGETVAMMQPQANRERVIIRSSFASKLPEVVADLRSVRQIALNILSNAVRYTQAGGQVIVSTAYEPNGEVVMRVRDTGIGMTQAEIEQALKPFKQVNALKRARGDGTGLGLPLTKAMVEANRAKFAIYSTPGEGTLVEIAFPSTRVLAE